MTKCQSFYHSFSSQIFNGSCLKGSECISGFFRCKRINNRIMKIDFRRASKTLLSSWYNLFLQLVQDNGVISWWSIIEYSTLGSENYSNLFLVFCIYFLKSRLILRQHVFLIKSSKSSLVYRSYNYRKSWSCVPLRSEGNVWIKGFSCIFKFTE